MIQWSDEHKCLIDYMGYPISRSEAIALRKAITTHLKKSPADLAAIARQIVRQQAPNMEEQMNLEPENFA